MSKPISAIYKNPETRGGITVKKSYNVPVDKIYIEEGFNVKGKIYGDTVDGMVKAYIDGQTLPNLVVEPQDDGTFKVIDGHHRYIAILEVINQGHDYRRVTVEGFNGTKAQQIALMVTSSQGRNLNPVERAEAYRRLSLFNLTKEELAQTFLVSVPSVVHHLLISELDSVIKNYIVDGKIAADYALELNRKHSVEDIIGIIEGTLTKGEKKATRKNTSSWRPAMGKTVVSILANVSIVSAPEGRVRLEMDIEEMDIIKEAISSLGL
jgi:ParB family chromosome partitioning protein